MPYVIRDQNGRYFKGWAGPLPMFHADREQAKEYETLEGAMAEPSNHFAFAMTDVVAVAARREEPKP